MFRKTKIVCTLGPSTDKEGVLKRLIEEGMNVARFNFSHGDHEEQLGRLQMLQKLRKELKRPVAALLDTKGPEIRLRDFTDGKVELKDGQTFTLTTDEIMGDAKRVSITYKNLPEDVKPGDRILIDDGLIGMEVKEIKVTSGAKADKDGNKPKDIICQVLNGGVISNRKGVNVPNVELSMPYISEKDYGDIVFAVEHDYDFIAASFVRTADDVLAMLFMTFFNSKKPILFPDITYSFYDVWAEMLRIPYTQIPLDDAFRLNPSDYKCENGGIVFPNPNAPTGELLPVSAIEEIIQANPDVIVIVDEAYIDFGGESALPLIDKYDNVIVVQTFSKSRSLAGSRIGFAISNPTLIKYLNDVKYSFNSYTMDRITIALGTASIRDRAYFEQTTEKIIKTREWTKEQLRALGFVFGDSKSNFIFAMHPDVSGVELFEALKKNDIYVRHFGKPARINEYLRITIGTDEQMHKLIDFLKKYLNK